MADYTTKHNPDPKWTPNLNALVEFMPAGEQARAAAAELTKLKALAALAEEMCFVLCEADKQLDGCDYESGGCEVFEMTVEYRKDYISRFHAITKDGGK